MADPAQLVVDFASSDGVVPPDIARASAAGVEVFVPRGIYGRPYGGQAPVYKDPVYALNESRIRAAGKRLSSYLLLCVPRKGLSTPEPEVQVQALLDYAPMRKPTPQYCKDYVSFIDVEEQSDRLTADEYYDWVLRACQYYFDKTGAWPGIYDSNRVWVEYLHGHPAGKLAACYRWFAKPWPWPVRTPAHLDGALGYNPTVPKQFGDSTAWGWYQYQGDAIQMPGFVGAVDLSRVQGVRRGAHGDVVRWIQRAIGFSGAQIDGDFGPKTELAVKTYQAGLGLIADGIVGAGTQAPMSWTPFAL